MKKGSKPKRDTGYKSLLRESRFNFLKWGEYMKRAQLAERKVEKLTRILLLTDPLFKDERMTELTIRQWNEFIREFPDEASTEREE